MAAQSTDDKQLTENEVAELTGFSVRTLQGWRQKKCGPPYRKVGRSVRYPKLALLAWNDSQMVAA